MSIAQLTDQLYISAQISPAEAAEAAQAGVRTVICNRPDGEEPGQPGIDEAARWFAEAGITEFHYLPVVAPQITEADAEQFHALLQQSPSPVLAYCRTGTRSSLLWAVGQAKQGQQPETLIDEVKNKTGLDLTNFAAKLQAAHGQ